MLTSATAYFRTKIQQISDRTDAIYQRALRIIGIDDCPEMQVVAAVAVSVALWYTCLGIQYLRDFLFNDVAPTLTALLTQ